MNHISYINKVEVTATQNFGWFFYSGQNAWVPNNMEFTEIPISGLATLTCEQNIDDKSVIYTSTLTFTVDTETMPVLDKVAFRLGAADGSRLLMGDDRRPYVMCTVTEDHPDSVGSAVKRTVKATWTGPRKPYLLK